MHAADEATDLLAEFANKTAFSDLPTEVVDAVTWALLDTVAVTVAGVATSPGQAVLRLAREYSGQGRATVIGTDLRCDPAWAALVNGTTGHALDYDDQSWAMGGHPSVVLFPTVLALAEEVAATGQDLIRAYALGFEAAGLVGRTVNPDHYGHGWHATGTVGAVAAAVAASGLLDLDVDSTRTAISLAASSAAGLRQNFGTGAKPFHAGNAARSGVVAAKLAAHGLDADPQILDGRWGFFTVFTPPGDRARPEVALGEEWHLLAPGIATKMFPSCGATHPGIGAMLELRSGGLRAMDVESIEARVVDMTERILEHHDPQTGLEAKFSLEYCLARTLVSGDVQLDHFTPEALREEEVRRLVARTKMVVDQRMTEEWVWGTPRAIELTVHCLDGTVREARADVPREAPVPSPPTCWTGRSGTASGAGTSWGRRTRSLRQWPRCHAAAASTSWPAYSVFRVGEPVAFPTPPLPGGNIAAHDVPIRSEEARHVLESARRLARAALVPDERWWDGLPPADIEAGRQRLDEALGRARALGFDRLAVPETVGGLGAGWPLTFEVGATLAEEGAPGMAAVLLADNVGAAALAAHGLAPSSPPAVAIVGLVGSQFPLGDPAAPVLRPDPAGTAEVVCRVDQSIEIRGLRLPSVASASTAAHLLVVVPAGEDGAPASVHLVETATNPRVVVGPPQHRIGLRVADHSEVRLEHVTLDLRSALLVGDGVASLLTRLVTTKCLAAVACAVGLASHSHAQALDYARTRVQGGRPIIEHPSIAQTLWDARACTAVGRGALRDVAGAGTGSSVLAAAELFTVTVRNARDVAVHMTELLGGYGVTTDYPMEKLYRDAQALAATSATVVGSGIVARVC
jgi:2-methylcitrate dehydratase PrpD/alkylation response protein AidB-like acyl-CoA dehydrogenase